MKTPRLFIEPILENALVLALGVFLIAVPYIDKVSAKWLFVGITCGWLLLNIVRHKHKFLRGVIPVIAVNRVILLFCLVSIISILKSRDIIHSQSILFERFFAFALCVWIGAGLARVKRNFNFLTLALLLASLIMGAGMLRDYIVYSKYAPNFAERIWSVFGKRIDYYALPLYLAVFIPLNFVIFVYARNKLLKAAGFLNFGLLLLGLLWNGTRMGLVAVFITAAAVYLVMRKNLIIVTATLITVVCLSLIVSHFSPELLWRLKTLAVPSEWSSRLPLYSSATSMFRDYPVFGIGLGMFEKEISSPRYSLPADYPVPKQWNLHAHNTYLEVAAEMGVVGLAVFILIFAVFFLCAYKRRVFSKENSAMAADEQAVGVGLMAAVFSILIFAFGTSIITVGFTVSSYFWSIFGIACGFVCRKEVPA